MKQDNQRGASTLASVATLFALGLFLLSALHRQLNNIHQITAEDQHHLRDFSQATSSLNWGLSQHWSFSRSWRNGSAWHCKQHQEYGLKACVKPASMAGLFILRGESQQFGSQPPLMLYQRVRLTIGKKQIGGYQLIKLPHGWSDFCPYKDERLCVR